MSEYSGPDRRTTERGLRFDRRVSLDTIVQIIGMAIVLGGPFIVWGRAMESRVLTLETTAFNAEKRDSQRDEFAKEQRTQMLDQLRKMETAVQAMQLSVAEIKTQLTIRPTDAQSRQR